MNKFEAGKSYWTRGICDHDCIYTCAHDCIYTIAVVSRTAKTVKIQDNRGERTLRVFIDYNGHEAVKPHGSYSMAAIISADDEGSGPAPRPEPASVLKRPTMTPAEMVEACALSMGDANVQLKVNTASGSVCLPNGSQWLYDSRFGHWACTRGPRS
jgi:hypothetical protein